MEERLKELNATIGVQGSFVCNPDGQILAHRMPAAMEEDQLKLAGRISAQTFQALNLSGLRLAEVDLVFGKGRLVIKALKGGLLVILCSRNINVPLLNLSANAAAKRIQAELRPARARATGSNGHVKPPEPVVEANAVVSPPVEAPPGAPAPEVVATTTPPPQPVTPAPAAAPTPQIQVAPIAAAPAAVELPTNEFAQAQSEALKVVEAAMSCRLILRAIGTVGVRAHCHTPRAWLNPPTVSNTLDFVGTTRESGALQNYLGRLGYAPNARHNNFYGGRRLVLDSRGGGFRLQIYLDAFDMYHRLDLSRHLREEPFTVAPTFQLLMRLQLVDIAENELREIAALLLDHELQTGMAQDTINLNLISDICGEEWGWYKTATINLKRLTESSAAWLDGSQQTRVAESARRITERIHAAPKSLRWQMRARLGEGSRWYQIPEEPSNLQRPDLAIG